MESKAEEGVWWERRWWFLCLDLACGREGFGLTGLPLASTITYEDKVCRGPGLGEQSLGGGAGVGRRGPFAINVCRKGS